MKQHNYIYDTNLYYKSNSIFKYTILTTAKRFQFKNSVKGHFLLWQTERTHKASGFIKLLIGRFDVLTLR
jgi:hypothetical protein